MTNDVFDPDAETYEWHPTLRTAVEARKTPQEIRETPETEHQTTGKPE